MSVADSNADSVREFITALEANELETAASFLHEQFMFSGWTPQPLNKRDFLSVIKDLKEGIPGLIFNLHNLAEHENAVTGTIQVAGYQSDSFILPVLGTPPIPQTATSISLPAENVSFTFENGLILQWLVQHVEGGGIRGLIRQLGFDLPIVQ